MIVDKKLSISIFIVWLFSVSGIIGILIGHNDWFLSLTPLHLSVYFLLIVWNSVDKRKIILHLSIAFFTGLLAEFLGVNYGLIFGDYTYGENLGYKIYGVPILIGVNWAILVYSSAAIAKKVCPGGITCSIFAAILMVFLDLIIEMSAPRFDFWEFKGGTVPIQNYVGWFVVSLVIQLIFQKLQKSYNYRLAIHIFLAIALFFAVFLFV